MITLMRRPRSIRPAPRSPGSPASPGAELALERPSGGTPAAHYAAKTGPLGLGVCPAAELECCPSLLMVAGAHKPQLALSGHRRQTP